MRTLRHKKLRPSHPGELVREIILPELTITQTEFAQRLGVSRRTISELVHEKRPLSPDMAIRLSRLVGRSAGAWLKMQQSLDLWEIENLDTKKYLSIKKLRSSKDKKAS